MGESRRLRIGAFVYNFEHKKTYDGLVKLFLEGFSVDCALAADRVDLLFYQSKVRVAPKGLEFMHPRDVAAGLNIPYHVVPHESGECERLIKEYALDVGIVLGARILKEPIINAFSIGVINLHPGLLPEMRGLDTIKWSIFEKKKQGVTAHLIDKYIDLGRMIVRKEIEVFDDDALVDILLRIQNLELKLMVESLHILQSGKRDFERIERGPYHRAVPEDLEKTLFPAFEEYKRIYRSLSVSRESPEVIWS